jgi:hypothetical protein
MNEDGMVVIRWSWEDVQSLQPDKSEHECREILKQIERQLFYGSVEAGWEIMKSLTEMETAQ